MEEIPHKRMHPHAYDHEHDEAKYFHPRWACTHDHAQHGHEQGHGDQVHADPHAHLAVVEHEHDTGDGG